MASQRVAGICFCLLVTSAIAFAQRQSTVTGQPYRPSATVSNSTFWDGDVEPLRRTQTRRESDGREVIVETLEGPDIGGRRTALEEVVTERTRGPNTLHTRQDVFRPTVNGQQRLAETSESRQDVQPNGDTVALHSNWASDVNGRLRLRSQLVEETRAVGPDVRRTDSTLRLPGINETLRDAQRTEYTEHRISPQVARLERTDSVRDVNGRWTPVEIRRGEVRTSASEVVEEETVQRPDVNGNLGIAEVNVIRSSGPKESEHVVIETYAGASYERRLNGRPPLDQRVERTTTPTADGGSYTVEEVEARSRVSPDAPMRVVQRIVTTVSPTGSGAWVTQRQIFEPDVNGRMRLVRIE